MSTMPERPVTWGSPRGWNHLWGLHRRSGLWRHLRDCAPGNEDGWMRVWSADEDTRREYAYLWVGKTKPKMLPKGAVSLREPNDH